MPKKSAGLLLFRDVSGFIEVLLVHPGGPFWAKKDEGAWSIPKGEFSEGEDPFRAALRECEEEMGQTVAGDFMALLPRRQPGGKIVHAWAVRADFDVARLRSNTFSIEWPPGSGRQQVFPEIDWAAWFPLDMARVKILKGQVGFLDELESKLKLPHSWAHFSHDADIGVVGIGPTKAEAFRQAALALTAVITDPTRVKLVDPVAVACEAPSDELLLVEWLNALIYEMAVRGMVFGDFSVVIDDNRLRATAYGEAVDIERHEPAVEIKGATLTALQVAQSAEGWRAQCVVDV